MKKPKLPRGFFLWTPTMREAWVRDHAPKPRKAPKGARWFGMREDEEYPVLSLVAGCDLWLTRAEVRRIELAEEEYEACQRLIRERYDRSPAREVEKAIVAEEARRRWAHANRDIKIPKRPRKKS